MSRGRFEGITDAQWRILEPLLPKEFKRRGKGVTPCTMEGGLQNSLLPVHISILR